MPYAKRPDNGLCPRPRTRKVVDPDGRVHVSVASAAREVGIAKSTLHTKVVNSIGGWRYADNGIASPLPLAKG